MESSPRSAVPPSSLELRPLDEASSRFQVARVDREAASATDEDPEQGLAPSDSSYVYDTRYGKSLGQLTREVPPRLEHYRDLSVRHENRPTLEELHEGCVREKDNREGEDEEEKNKKGKVIKFGWLEGVFMRCLLNIWGVMLFLRLSWVIGQAGMGEGVTVICLANVVTLLTTISMSAVCTNGQIKGGGVYYMISRSLGPEFGGAIGLMFTLANSIAVSMYVVGFCESLQDLLRTFGVVLIDGAANDIRVVGVCTLVAILVLAVVGMDWVTRAQMVLLVVLIASQIDFVIGSALGPKSDEEVAKGFVGYNMATFKENLPADYRYFEGVDHSFFSVFAVFFPAVTGIVAGANLSGDLKDPSSAIPIGTLLAILVTFVSYVGYAFMMGSCMLRDASGNVTEYLQVRSEGTDYLYSSFSNCTTRSCRYGLQNDNQAMELVSWWGPLIYGGCFAATLSSAIASLVGAPRVLQALAKDKLYPFIGFFAKGHGANNDPVRGYLLVFIISLGCILIAQLNSIAPLLSNFFLAAYALINFSVFHASISKSPGWRPAFKYYNAWVSLLGTLLCIAVMFLMSWWTALITFFVVITLYLYVSYRKPDVNWGSSTQAHSYNSALKSLLELNRVELHVKNYRPQLLVLTGMPGTRPPLVDFANMVTKGLSLLLCANIIEGNHSQRVHDAFSSKAYQWFSQHRVKAFFTLTEGDFETASQAFMQLCGVGRLRPNMLLMGYKSDWQTCNIECLKQYFNVIHNALDRYLAVGILRMPSGLDYSKLILDEEFVPVSKLDKKAEREKLIRNQSSCHLSQVTDAVTIEPETPDTPPLSPLIARAGTTSSQDIRRLRKKNKTASANTYLGPSGESLPQDILDQVTVFRRKQPKGYIDVWWLYDDGGDNKAMITDAELYSLRERTNRHMRIRELLKQYSLESTFIVMSLPIPRKGVVSAPLYMAWLEMLTRGMPPYLIVRGNQTSVLTFYS
ncbi:bumetanide-sensitive sodium-(potassium)-chloride cotransporter-like isoform X2 [Bacillus rossius redtenbacheri]|uniref:bumetanide-sensitive sodium-(potassium)-chloride cotransporter-like isoform X2 n=1 Tax=Bacillus rossius redtenbacheri TaxID=93214 RepID=UPI002FDE27DD